MEEMKSRVYIKVNEQNQIIQIEGEYSLSNFGTLDECILIEEGTPCDRLNHAQNHYFAKPLINMDGTHNYYYEDEIREATPEELAEELSILHRPSEIAELKQKLADTDYCVIKVAEGSATLEDYAELIEQRKEWRARINELEV